MRPTSGWRIRTDSGYVAVDSLGRFQRVMVDNGKGAWRAVAGLPEKQEYASPQEFANLLHALASAIEKEPNGYTRPVRT